MNKNQPAIIWFTGLSGSGKSTIANAISKELNKQNIKNIVLDGDVLRTGLNSDLTYSETDRLENVRRTVEVAKIFAEQDYIVLAPLMTPTKQARDLVDRIKNVELIKIYCNVDLETCIARDTKGLYKKAFDGELKNFYGVDLAFDQQSALDWANINLDTSSLEYIKPAIDLVVSILEDL